MSRVNPFGKQGPGVIKKMFKLHIYFLLLILEYLLRNLVNTGFKYLLQCIEETCKILGPSKEASSEDETNSVQRMSIKSNFLRKVQSVDFIVQDLGILALICLCTIINL